MKKLLVFLIGLLCLSACTTKEQDEKIHAFWAQQLGKLPAGARMAAAGAFSNAPTENPLVLEQSSNVEANTSLTNALKGKVTKTQTPTEKLTASLYLSPTCPWCKKVQQEGFTKKFNQKYGDLIILQEYMLDNNQNMALYSAAVKKHKLSGGVPLLIIGDSPIQGYSPDLLTLASQAADKEIKKHNLSSEKDEAQKMPSFLEISLEDEQIKGAASAPDKEKMKKLILDMQETNGSMIQSIGETFGPVVKNKAMSVAANTEKQLKKAADSSASFAEFAQKHAQIATQNTNEMNKLMRDNTSKIRKRRTK